MRISDWSSDVCSSDLRGGLPVRADIAGARLREGGRVGRIPEPIYSAFQAALAVNAADDPDQRRAAFAELRSTLGADIGTGIEADGFLERVRIAYAANFSLNAKTEHGRFDKSEKQQSEIQ